MNSIGQVSFKQNRDGFACHIMNGNPYLILLFQVDLYCRRNIERIRINLQTNFIHS